MHPFTGGTRCRIVRMQVMRIRATMANWCGEAGCQHRPSSRDVTGAQSLRRGRETAGAAAGVRTWLGRRPSDRRTELRSEGVHPFTGGTRCWIVGARVLGRHRGHGTARAAAGVQAWLVRRGSGRRTELQSRAAAGVQAWLVRLRSGRRTELRREGALSTDRNASVQLMTVWGGIMMPGSVMF